MGLLQQKFTGIVLGILVIETSLKHNDKVRTAFPECFLLSLIHILAWPIIIMNFTGVYDYEAFARNNKFIWLDCRHLYGTDAVSYTHLDVYHHAQCIYQ